MAGNSTLTFTDAAFDSDVLKSPEPVLVDFWAEWCGPCRQMGPTIDTIASEYAGKAKVGKLNVDDNGQTAMRYNVRGIPTLLLFSTWGKSRRCSILTSRWIGRFVPLLSHFHFSQFDPRWENSGVLQPDQHPLDHFFFLSFLLS